MTHTPHALTHKNNPKITRAPLPALLPTILTGLFILAGCGGSALPIPVIATESADVANKAESTAPDSILLSVDEQPPVDTVKSADSTTTPPAETPIVQVQKQEPKPAPKPEPKPVPVVPTPDSQEEEQVQKQEEEQAPPPVFEVAVAPALPPQRSFSQSQPEPQTSTETVKRIDTTASQTVVRTAPITFADWVNSFSFGGDKKLPINAETTTTEITATYASQYVRTSRVAREIVNDGAMRPRGIKFFANAATPFVDGEGYLTNLDNSELIITKDTALTTHQVRYIRLHGRLNDSRVISPPADTTRTETVGVKNQFLQGVDALGGRLDETPRAGDPTGHVSDRGGLNLATATFGGRKLGGDIADGVGFFRGFSAKNPSSTQPDYVYSKEPKIHNYAGIYSGTNLGAPVSGTGEALWNGRIRTIGYFQFDMDFTLKITFGEGNIGTLSLNEDKLLNPKNTNQFLQIIDATYDVNGVISGTILIDEDMETQGIRKQYGFLTGLIGADGAVAAFLSSGKNVLGKTGRSGTKEDITDGSHEFGYAGGFVAHPTAIAAPANPNVRIDAWTGGFANLKRNVKRFRTVDATPQNAFLLRDDPAKRPNWKKKEGGFLSLRTSFDGTDDTVNNPTSLGGDATDGVDFFPADITIVADKSSTGYQTRTQRHYYAGIWDTTDLGAPIPYRQDFNNVPSAEWNGKFSVLQGANARFDTDFKLTVDFVNAGFRTITAIEAGAEDYYLSGRYDADGLLTGVVRRAANASNSSPKSGLISGLIGQEGLVAAFVSNIGGSGMDAENKDTIKGGTGSSGYAGGFVAISTPAIDVYSLPNYDAIPVTLAGLENTATPARGFLRIADGAALNTAGITSPTPFTGRRNSTASDKGFGDGYTFVRNGGYAAILPTTYLGMPRPVGDGQATDARWTGTYSLGGDLATNAPITFDINFRVSTLTGTAPLTSSSSNNITINTTFGPTGVMHGTFSTDTTTPIEAGDTRVMGLIGTEGLVGIMHGQDTAGAVVSGGFVASPPSE